MIELVYIISKSERGKQGVKVFEAQRLKVPGMCVLSSLISVPERKGQAEIFIPDCNQILDYFSRSCGYISGVLQVLNTTAYKHHLMN